MNLLLCISDDMINMFDGLIFLFSFQDVIILIYNKTLLFAPPIILGNESHGFQIKATTSRPMVTRPLYVQELPIMTLLWYLRVHMTQDFRTSFVRRTLCSS